MDTGLRINKSQSLFAIGLTGAVLAFVASCSSEAQVDNALKGSGVEIEGLGKQIPASFPADEVALPNLELESAVGTAGTYVFRYSTSSPAADVARYRGVLAESGFSIASEFDNLSEPAAGNNVGFTASSRRYTVVVAAFGPGDLDGLYMGISVSEN